MTRQFKHDLLALLSGMAMPLSFAPFYGYPVAVVSLAVLFHLWSAATPTQAARQGGLFGLGMYGVGVSWIYVAIHDFGQASVLLAGLLTAIFVAFLALYLAVLGWGIKKISAENLAVVDIVLLLPAAWWGYEWFKGWFLTGFPWLDLGVGQIEGPLAGFVPVVGVEGVSLLTALSASLWLVVWKNHKFWPVLLLAVLWISGIMLHAVSWTQPVGQPLKVSLIQGNIPQEIKWDRQQLFKTLALYEARTEQHWESDLIVWPENAVPIFYQQVQSFFLEPLAQKARAHHTDLLIGLPVSDPETGGYYNAMMSLGSQQAFYFKRHLVPFGETLPFSGLRGLIQFFDLPMSSFQAGQQRLPLLQVAHRMAGVSICYEDVFSSELRPALPKAQFLVNASNNAWYGDSFAPHQHLQISRSRALEFGRPLLRATTNGISAIVDMKGRVKQQSPQFQETVLTGRIQPRQGATPYVWIAPWFWLCPLVMWLLWASGRKRVIR